MANATLNKTVVVAASAATICNEIESNLKNLLYLETLRRAKEDNAKLRRLMEDKMRQFEEARANYTFAFGKIVELTKLAATRQALQGEVLELEEAKLQAEHIIEQIRPDQLCEVLDAQQLLEFKRLLNSAENYENLQEQSELIMQEKECLEAMQAANQELTNSLLPVAMQTINSNAQQITAHQMQDEE